MLDLTLAVGHHLLVFTLLGVLVAELSLLRAEMPAAALARLSRIDLSYGLLALAVVVFGFSRAVFAAKGWDYYSHNLFFWAKISAFVGVGLASVPPTIAYIRWRRAGAAPTPEQVRGARAWLLAELALCALLPIFAAAMSRGYGEFR